MTLDVYFVNLSKDFLKNMIIGFKATSSVISLNTGGILHGRFLNRMDVSRDHRWQWNSLLPGAEISYQTATNILKDPR